jgi:TonB-linked SusC/RagA family outer membrane protein
MEKTIFMLKGMLQTFLLMTLLIISIQGFTQSAISGRVSSTDGEPVPGVTIVIKGSTIGTVADADGKYSLNNVPSDATLVFSFVGMKTQEIPVADRTIINAIMEEETIGLEEVVAIGYGTQKKVNLVGAVGVISAERLENRPITSAGQGLQGVIPNLNISIPSGDPSESADYNVRGFESINGGSPLILVDGVPMDIERINPSDIKSVSVLKDAAAAAVYGARAAFGVILVETKMGGKGEKLNVNLSTEQSLAKPIFLMDPITDPYIAVTAWNEANIRSKGEPKYNDTYVEGTKRWVENPTEENAWGVINESLVYFGNNDYLHKLITDFAPQQKYDISISGSSDRSTFYVSFGYLNKDGYLRMSDKNIKYKRYNILIKNSFKISDWISIDEKIAFNSQYSNKPHSYSSAANLNSAARVNPITPLQFPNLEYYIEPGDRDQFAQYIGMYFDENIFLPYLKDGGRETFTTNDLWLTQGLTLTPFKGVKIRSDFSYNTYHRDYQDVVSKVEVIASRDLRNLVINNGFSGDDGIVNTSEYNQYYVYNIYGEYTFDKNEDHYLKAMVGFNQEWGRYTYISASAKSLITPGVTDIHATTGVQQTDGGKSQVALRGLFYRLNYSYKDKYLIETNGRYDGTSRFPKDSRFGFFPSVAFAWRISKESFFENAGWLDNLKIRASYGELGNQLLGSNYYPYISTMGIGSSNYAMSTGYIPYTSASALVSPSLTWERVATKNIGFDITLLNQRLDISADAYIRDTKDMLMEIKYPDILGSSAPKQNAADLRTKGWELSINWHDKIGSNWKYNINLALSDNQSEITKYDNPTGSLSEYYVGKKIGEIWGYVTEGIFQTDDEVADHADQSQIGANWEAGDMKYADLDNDGYITAGSNTLGDPGDRAIIGNTTPRYSFGINPGLSYKNWSLNVFFQGLFRDFLPDNGGWNAFYPFNAGHIEKYYLTETWSPDNPDAYFAAPHIGTVDNKNILPQSRYVQNAAYIRLKNLTLNYNIPYQWISKIGITRAQVYFSGMNLWEYTKMHKPLDPEATTVSQRYYLQRIYTLGVKVSF